MMDDNQTMCSDKTCSTFSYSSLLLRICFKPTNKTTPANTPPPIPKNICSALLPSTFEIDCGTNEKTQKEGKKKAKNKFETHERKSKFV